ncbi:hypothetical protein P2318_19950 [Myxococcaceae bacterium GXIMD 01537]
MKLHGRISVPSLGDLASYKLLLGTTPATPLFSGGFTSPQGDFLFQKIVSAKVAFPLSLYVLRDGLPVAERAFADKAALDAVLVAEDAPIDETRRVVIPVLESATRKAAVMSRQESQSRLTALASTQTSTAVPKESLESFSFQGTVVTTSGSIAGYVLELSCPDTIADDSQATPIHREFLLGPDGAFHVDIVASGRFSSSPLTLVVRTPNGLPTRLISPTYLTLSQALKMFKVEVKVEPFSPRVLTSGSSAPAATRVLKGRLVDPSGKAMKNQQIIFYGHRDTSEGSRLEIPLTTVTTHSSGNFSAIIPNEPFDGAHAVVSSRPDAPSPVLLDAGGHFPAFALLVIESSTSSDEGSEEDDDCACHDPTPRLPGTEELVSGESSYSQDIGGSCVNFTVPNRTLEEFSHYAIVRTTDPRGQLVPIGEDPAWEWNGDMADMANYAKHLHRTLRQTLGSKNPIRWDDDGTDFELYQAVTLAHGHVLHFKQTFKADGYSMGDLLYSLPLAPGQKKQLVIYDWNRDDTASRSEGTTVEEQLDHSLSRDRDIDEILSGTVRESMKGGSSAKTRGSAFGLGLAGSGRKDGVAVGLSTGFSISGGSASSSAWQNNTRDMTSSLHNRLRDSTMQATSAVRSQRSTVVTNANQGESFSVQTEVVANHNHCHALTIQYFEILRHFVVDQALVDVQECIFVPLMMSRFTDAKILRWRECLSEHLLYAGTTAKGQELRSGFAALERIASNYQGVDFPQRQESNGSVTFLPFCDETLDEISGEFQLRLTLSRPADLEDGTLDVAAWATLSHIFLGLDIQGIRNLLIKLTVAERERVFQEKHAPALARNFVEQLRFEAILADGTTMKDLRLDCTLLTDYAPGKPLTVSVRSTRSEDLKALKAGATQQPFSGTPTDLKRSQIIGLRMRSPSVSQSGSFAIVDRGTLRYRTRHFSGVLLNDRAIRNDIGFADQLFLPTPMSPEEQRNPWQEDKRLAQQLRDHLNLENLEYYHHVIWCHGITQHRRYMMLDRIHLAQEEFNAVYAQRGVLGRSLASLVENRLLGVAGNCLIFPVARGFNLDPTYELGSPAQSGSGAIAYASLLEHYQTEAERAGGQKVAFRLSVPTPGVFAEAVRGACNACERIDDTRFWRWEQSPIDEPTAINAVSTDSRYQAPQDTTPTALPQPIVNIQNAPAAPDPTGAGALLTALTQTSPFANLTGLDQNQKNALAALTTNTEAAKSYAEMATTLALAAQTSRNSSNLNEQINKAFPSNKYPEKNLEWKGRVLGAQLGGASRSSKTESPLGQLNLQETIDAVRTSPGMEVAVDSDKVSVRNHARRARSSSSSSGSSSPPEGSAPDTDGDTQPSWPGIEGYAEGKALFPRMFEIIEDSAVFVERVIEPFIPKDSSEYVPLVMEVLPEANEGVNGFCIVEVRDPADTTTPGGRWISLFNLSRDLPGFDPNQHVRLRLNVSLRGDTTAHPAGMVMIMSHEWALHGLGWRGLVLQARRGPIPWTLRQLRDAYVDLVSREVHHDQIKPGTNAAYEEVNDDLEAVLQRPRWRRNLMLKIKGRPVPAGEPRRPENVLLALPARATAPQPSDLFNLNFNYDLYSLYQMFVFERELEKDVHYDDTNYFNRFGKDPIIDNREWEYIDPEQP